MCVISTRTRVAGSTPARSSFWKGLPPQSTSTASPSLTNTSAVLSRSREGTERGVPRTTSRTTRDEAGSRRPSPGPLPRGERVTRASDENGHEDQRGQHAEQADELGDPDGPQHERVGAEPLGEEAARRVQAQIDEEQ